MASFVYDSRTVRVNADAASPALLGALLNCCVEGMVLVDPDNPDTLIQAPENIREAFAVTSEGPFFIVADPAKTKPRTVFTNRKRKAEPKREEFEQVSDDENERENAGDSSDEQGTDDDGELETAMNAAAASSSSAAKAVLNVREQETAMQSAVDEVAGIVQIPPSLCRLLLNHFKWNQESLIEKYYEASDLDAFFRAAHVSPPSSTASTSRAAQLILAAGSQSTTCSICLEEKPLIVLGCLHCFCSECCVEYILHKMLECMAEIACPAPNCGIFIDDHRVLTILTDDDDKQRYKTLIVKSFVEHHGLLRWCPTANCDHALKLPHGDAGVVQELACTCGARICASCREEGHAPINCRLLRMWLEKTLVDECETMRWLKDKTKDCPKCKSAIEKNGGCNHMTCRKCNHEFCWICLQASHGHYGCNRYKETESPSRDNLERFLHYSTRFVAHRQSRLLEVRLKEKMEGKVADLQQLFGYGWSDLRFLIEAVAVLASCRQTMMYSYAFAFYLRRCNQVLRGVAVDRLPPIQAFIFEDNQNDLERATEQLSELLEGEDLYNARLNVIKPKVIDTAQYVQQRQAVLLKHCVDEADNWSFVENGTA